MASGLSAVPICVAACAAAGWPHSALPHSRGLFLLDRRIQTLWAPLPVCHLPRPPGPCLPSGTLTPESGPTNPLLLTGPCSQTAPPNSSNSPFQTELRSSLLQGAPPNSPDLYLGRNPLSPIPRPLHALWLQQPHVSQCVFLWHPPPPPGCGSERKGGVQMPGVFSPSEDARHRADCLDTCVEWMNDHYYLTYPIYTNITAILRAWSPIFDFIWQRKEEIKSFCDTVEFA